MNMYFLIGIIIAACCGSSWSDNALNCPDNYNLLRHQSAVIQCGYEQDFDTVRWFFNDEGDVFLRVDNSVPSGPGYTTGEFDIMPNGAMIIKEVDIKHEGNYTIEALEYGKTGLKAVITVHVTDPVKELAAYECDDPSVTLCQGFDQTPNFGRVLCVARDAYPSVQVTWKALGKDGSAHSVNQSLIESHVEYNDSTSLYTSISSLKYDMTTFRLQYFTCIPTGRAVGNVTDASIMVEGDVHAVNATPKVEYAVKGIPHDIEITCPSENFPIGILYYKPYNGTGTRVSETAITDHTGKCLNEGVKCHVTGHGKTVLKDVTYQDDGAYQCISSDGLSAQQEITDIVTIIPPLNNTVFIEGCEDTQPCYMHTNHSGSLTCYVKGAKPKVYLEFIVEKHVIITDETNSGLTYASMKTSDTILDVDYTIEECSGTVMLTCSPVLGDDRSQIAPAHVYLTTDNDSCSSNAVVITICVLIGVAAIIILGLIIYRRKTKVKKVPREQERIPLKVNGKKLIKLLFDNIKKEELSEEEYQEAIEDIYEQTQVDPLLQLEDFVKTSKDFTEKVLIFMMTYFVDRKPNSWITPVKSLAIFLEKGQDNPDMFLPILAEMYEHEKIALNDFGTITKCLLQEKRKSFDDIVVYLKPTIKAEEDLESVLLRLQLQYYVIDVLSQDAILANVDYYGLSEKKVKYVLLLQSVQERIEEETTRTTNVEYQDRLYSLFDKIVTTATAMEAGIGQAMNEMLLERQNMRRTYAAILLFAYGREQIEVNTCKDILLQGLEGHQERALEYRKGINDCSQNGWIKPKKLFIFLRYGHGSEVLIDEDFINEQVGHQFKDEEIRSDESILELEKLMKKGMLSEADLKSYMKENLINPKWTGDDWITFVAKLSVKDMIKPETAASIVKNAATVHTQISRKSVKEKLDQAGVPKEKRRLTMNGLPDLK